MSTHGRFGLWTGLAVAALMLGTLAVGVTYAQQQAGPGGGGRRAWQRGGMMRNGPMGPGLGFALRQLNLTSDQQQQVKTIFAGHHADFQALAQRAQPARRALVDAIFNGDEAAIRQSSGELAAVQTDRALLAAKVKAEVFKILTPDQQQKAQSLRQLEQRMEQRRQKGPGGPGGPGFQH